MRHENLLIFSIESDDLKHWYDIIDVLFYTITYWNSGKDDENYISGVEKYWELIKKLKNAYPIKIETGRRIKRNLSLEELNGPLLIVNVLTHNVKYID